MTAIPGGYREGMDKNILTCCRGSRTKARLAEEAPRWLIATVYREEDSLDARVLAGAKEAYELIKFILEPIEQLEQKSYQIAEPGWDRGWVTPAIAPSEVSAAFKMGRIIERARKYMDKINGGSSDETP